MRHLKRFSYIITGMGIALVAVALLADLDPTLLLIGLMLIIAGGVKIGMVALWNGVADFGSPVDQTISPVQSRPGSQRGEGT